MFRAKFFKIAHRAKEERFEFPVVANERLLVL